MPLMRSDEPAARIDRAVEVLRRGGLVAFPTETVYGLGADASNPRAVERIFEVKGRPANHPVIVHLGRADAVDGWAVDISSDARRLMDAFWPGPLTVLVARASRVPDVVTGGSDRVGLRVPGHPMALDLLEGFGGGIAAPSANRFGAVSPTTAAHVRADLGDDVDLILDGGPTDVGVESTIVDCTTSEPEVLRPGGVSFEALARVLGRPAAIWMGDRRVAAPGTLAAHYAPGAQVRLVDDASAVGAATSRALEEGKVVGVLAPSAIDGLAPEVYRLPPAGDVDAYARVVYDRLRTADRLGIDVLVVVPPPDHGIGRAVRDRLRRAAATTSEPC